MIETNLSHRKEDVGNEYKHEWLKRLYSDIDQIVINKCLLSIRPNIDNNIVYHCQQALEKAIKLYLIASGMIFFKRHAYS